MTVLLVVPSYDKDDNSKSQRPVKMDWADVCTEMNWLILVWFDESTIWIFNFIRPSIKEYLTMLFQRVEPYKNLTFVNSIFILSTVMTYIDVWVRVYYSPLLDGSISDGSFSDSECHTGYSTHNKTCSILTLTKIYYLSRHPHCWLHVFASWWVHSNYFCINIKFLQFISIHIMNDILTAVL